MSSQCTSRPGNGHRFLGLALVLLASILSQEAPAASRSLVVTTNARITRDLPAGTPGWNSLGAYRIEGRLSIKSLPAQSTSIFRVANDLGVLLSPEGALFTTLRGAAGGPFCSLNGGTEVRFRMRRDQANTEYTLELWNELTGSYCLDRRPDSNPSAYNVTGPGSLFAIGALYEPISPNIEVAFLRVYSSPKNISATPPLRFVSSDYGDLVNFEFENSLNDLSGRNLHLSVQQGSISYLDTPRFAPIMNILAPASTRAGARQRIEAAGFANDDSSGIRFSWRQKMGPFEGIWRKESETVVIFTPPVAGSYELTAVVNTDSGLSAQRDFVLQAVLTDRNNAILISNPAIQSVLGPLVRQGANPWSWFDDRAIAAAEYQIDMQTGANGAPPFWSAPWETNLAGTLTVTNGSTTVTGTGTQFQTSFCGGSGNTTPSANFGQIYIKYNSAEYPGTQGLARYNVTACVSQTQLTINFPWSHATGTQSGISHARADAAIAGWWTNTNTPGNYYDNVLAFYALYYRTGLTKYRTAARTLAKNWWYGPFYDRGKNYDTAAMGGCCISAGPARGQSITGLILWWLDTGENIWPGLNYVLSWFRDVGWNYGKNRNWNVQIGDLREQGYLTAAYALAARHHPDANVRQTYRGYLKDYINLFWKPLQLPTGEWQNTVITNAQYSANSYITVTTGSSAITLTNGTWSPGTFCNGNFSPCDYQARVWFFSNYSDNNLPGKQNSDIGGDAAFYRVINVTSATTAVLDRPYTGPAGNKGMIVSSLVGFGTQPFMLGLTAGVFGTFVYDALVWHGDTAEAETAKQFTIDAIKWLITPVAFKSGPNYIYGGSTFLNCQADPDSPGCAGDTVLNGEVMRGFAAAYRFTLDETILRFGDNAYGAIWCKTTGDWTCPAGGNGVYGNYLDDPPQGFMLNRADPLTNKWFGFFFGYGGGYAWPIARNQRPSPGNTSPIAEVSLQVDFNAHPNIGIIRVTMLYPDGTYDQKPCTSSPCPVSVDTVKGSPIYRLDFFTSADILITSSEWSTLEVD